MTHASTVIGVHEDASDAELISRVRGGDLDSYGDLFARHRDSATRLARQLLPGPDADDLVAEAFAKVMNVLLGGGGPDVSFRPYLLTAIRRLHVDKIRSTRRAMPTDDLTPYDDGVPFSDTVISGFEGGAAAKAFASLPERWQLVLWHLEVEGAKPADVAPLLGMTANSVSALAYRAREGLRQAFLQMHASDIVDGECEWTHAKLGAYVRNGLSRRDAGKVDDHLDGCRQCTALYLELREVNSELAGVLGPLVLGGAAAGYLAASGTVAGAGGLAGALTWFKDTVGANTQATVAVGATAAVAVAATVALAVLNGDDPVTTAGGKSPATSQLPPPSDSLTSPPATSPKSPVDGPQDGADPPAMIPAVGTDDDPAGDPTGDPTADPTADPVDDPVDDPTNDPDPTPEPPPTPPADTTAPTAPGNLRYSTDARSTGVSFEWNRSTDDQGVEKYVVLANGDRIGTTTGTRFSTSLPEGQDYRVHVVAQDAAGNTSTRSNTVSFTTPSEPPDPTTLVGVAATFSQHGQSGNHDAAITVHVLSEVLPLDYTLTLAEGSWSGPPKGCTAVGSTMTCDGSVRLVEVSLHKVPSGTPIQVQVTLPVLGSVSLPGLIVE